MKRKLTNEEIDKLASRKGVKEVAVRNFLGTLYIEDKASDAYMNCDMDSRVYKWNATTVKAIRDGIKLIA